jgi:hypothetical protein
MTSTIKVNTVTTESGSTLTLGESGKTVTLASGASQSGFGRTGTVDWQTTPKTGDFTAANGEGYFVNTTSGAITMTMPSGSAGAIVSIQDYNKTFDSNALTITPASGEKINGGTVNGNLAISTEGQGLTFVYVDATVGWKTVHENEFTSGGATIQFVTATGGTITTCGDFKIHTFTGPGTFCVSCGGNPSGSDTVDYLVVAGGGSGGVRQPGNANGGGGAGGFRYSASTYTSPSCAPGHPLRSPTGLPVSAQGYPITVGAGGAGRGPTTNPGNDGSNSIFSSVTSTGGGGGGNGSAPSPGRPGGSGGGGGGGSSSTIPAGAGNTPPVSPSQGNPGGTGGGQTPDQGSAGGGGAIAAGSPKPSQGPSGPGGAGAGLPTAFGSNGQPCGSFRYYAGGGAQGASPGPYGAGTGGLGGGASGEDDGTANTGGGGGGSISTGGGSGVSGAGGSGIVVIRYKFQ